MKIYIATPCAHEVVTSGYAAALHDIARELARKGITSVIEVLSFSDLELSRNILASKMFDDPSNTHLLFIDSDMSFSANLISRMIEFDEPFVGAIYPRR